MPRFRLNKLIRDRLVDAYETDGQTATYRHLSDAEYRQALVQKVIEELGELDIHQPDTMLGELADIRQALTDLEAALGLSPQAVEEKVTQKYASKGGFEGRHFITTLELHDNDPWVDYYRKDPQRFPEEPRPATKK